MEKAKKTEEKEVRGDSATVVWRGGERTYTREEHGADFKEMAKEFAAKKGGEVV